MQQSTTISKDITIDPVRNCIILKNPDGFPSGSVTVRSVIRAIRKVNLMSWKEIANYLGVGKASSIFKVYLTRNKITKVTDVIARQLFISNDKTEVHLYKTGFAPVGDEYPAYTPVVVENNEPEMTIPTKIPTRIFTRVHIEDPLDRCLTLTILPTNGYIIDDKSVRITTTNALFQVSGRAKALTRLLHNLHYVGVDTGEGEVIVTVDDGLKTDESVVRSEIHLNTVPHEVISVPTLTLTNIVSTDEAPVTVGEDIFMEDIITVADLDNKIIGMRITPFDCRIYGFKTTSDVFHQGDIYSISGMPDYINDVISNLRITPLAELCHIGVELRSLDPNGSNAPIKIQEYLEITAVAPVVEDPEEDEDTVPGPIYPDGLQDVGVTDKLPDEWPDDVDPDGLLIEVDGEEDTTPPATEGDGSTPESQQYASLDEWKADSPTVTIVTPTAFEGDFSIPPMIHPWGAIDTSAVMTEAGTATLVMTIDQPEITQMNLGRIERHTATISKWELGVVEDGNFVLVQQYNSLPTDTLVFPEPFHSAQMAIRVYVDALPEGASEAVVGLIVELANNNKHYSYTPPYLLP